MDATGCQTTVDARSTSPIDVSVIVPFRNAEQHIESCIEALLAQSHPPARYEIVMVDNNSTDRSAEIVRRHPRIRLLSEEKQGSYAARNRGVAAAGGELLAFTDADCTPSPDWLQRLVTALRSPGVEVVLGGRLYAAESGLLSMLEAYEAERAAQVFSWKSSEIYYGYTNNMGARREVFDRYGPFVEVARGADSLFVRSVVKARPPEVVLHVPEAQIRHLEMSSVRRWLHKKFIYGRSLQQNLHLRGPHRRLTAAERRSILRGALRRKPCPRLQAACFVLLAWMGSISFMAGRASVALRGWLGRP